MVLILRKVRKWVGRAVSMLTQRLLNVVGWGWKALGLGKDVAGVSRAWSCLAVLPLLARLCLLQQQLESGLKWRGFC